MTPVRIFSLDRSRCSNLRTYIPHAKQPSWSNVKCKCFLQRPQGLSHTKFFSVNWLCEILCHRCSLGWVLRHICVVFDWVSMHIWEDLNTWLTKHLHTCIRTYTHTNIHRYTYIHAYIHKCTHTNIDKKLYWSSLCFSGTVSSATATYCTHHFSAYTHHQLT